MRNYLKDLRKKTGITQKQLASSIEMNRPNYNKLENGKRNRDMGIGIIIKLAAALSQPAERLFELEREYQDQLNNNKSDVS